MKALGAVLCLTLATPAFAQDWFPLDARSRAMGGAGVALAEGPGATYWNPAHLAAGAEHPFDFATGWGFEFSFGLEATLVGDIASTFSSAMDLNDDLDEIDIDALRDRVNVGTHTPTDVQDALRIVNGIDRLGEAEVGVLIQMGTGFDLKVGPFGFFARSFGTVGFDPFFDPSALGGASLTSGSMASFFQPLSGPPPGELSPAGDALSQRLQACGLTGNSDGDAFDDSIELAYQAQVALGDSAISDPGFQDLLCRMVETTLSGPGASSTFSFDAVGFDIRSVFQSEAGISFGLPVYPTLLSVGIALKEVITESISRRITYADIEGDRDIEEILRDAVEERETEIDFNIDLGAVLTPLPGLRLGLSARNVIPMEIDLAGGGEVETDPKLRFGAAYAMLGFITVGADIDLLKYESDLLSGHESQRFGAGIEFDFAVLQLRAGIMENLASDEGRVVTAGLGLNFYFLRLDIAAEIGMDEITLEPVDPGDDPTDIRNHGGFAITLGTRFGF